MLLPAGWEACWEVGCAEGVGFVASLLVWFWPQPDLLPPTYQPMGDRGHRLQRKGVQQAQASSAPANQPDKRAGTSDILRQALQTPEDKQPAAAPARPEELESVTLNLTTAFNDTDADTDSTVAEVHTLRLHITH